MVEEAIEKNTSARRHDGTTTGASELKIGDRVRTGQGKVGVVAELRSDGRVVVEIGAVRLVIAPELLERADVPTGRRETS